MPGRQAVSVQWRLHRAGDRGGRRGRDADSVLSSLEMLLFRCGEITPPKGRQVNPNIRSPFVCDNLKILWMQQSSGLFDVCVSWLWLFLSLSWFEIIYCKSNLFYWKKNMDSVEIIKVVETENRWRSARSLAVCPLLYILYSWIQLPCHGCLKTKQNELSSICKISSFQISLSFVLLL